MLDWLTNLLRETGTRLAGELLVAALAVAAGYAAYYLRLASARLRERTRHELADAAIRRVEELATVTVLALESTTARAIRKAVADGKVDRAELIAVGEEAWAEVMRQLDTSTRRALEATVGDVEAFVRKTIEAVLEDAKARGLVARAEELSSPKSSARGSETSVSG